MPQRLLQLQLQQIRLLAISHSSCGFGFYHCCNLLRWLRHILSHHLYDSITGSVQSSCHRHLLICRKFWRFFSDLQDLAVSQASFLRGSDHHSNAIEWCRAGFRQCICSGIDDPGLLCFAHGHIRQLLRHCIHDQPHVGVVEVDSFRLLCCRGQHPCSRQHVCHCLLVCHGLLGSRIHNGGLVFRRDVCTCQRLPHHTCW